MIWHCKCSNHTPACSTSTGLDAFFFVHNHTRIDKKKNLIIVCLCLPLVVSQQDLAVNDQCCRNVGQPISGEAVHTVVRWCLCSAK